MNRSEKLTLNTGKPSIPSGLICTIPIATLVSLGLFITYLATKMTWSLVSAAVLFLLCFLTDYIFEFHGNSMVEVKDARLVWHYDLDSSLMGSNCHVTVTSKSIMRVKAYGQHVTIYGRFIKKAPRKKDSELNKITIPTGKDIETRNRLAAMAEQLI